MDTCSLTTRKRRRQRHAAHAPLYSCVQRSVNQRQRHTLNANALEPHSPPWRHATTATRRRQVNTGRIVGTVQDPSKAAIPNATVVVTDTATNQAITVLTSERGDFVVTPLNPGTYQVTVTMDGFQTAVVKAAEVQVGQSTRVDVELTLGALTESTIVTSATPLLDTESGTLGHVVTNTQIVNLPLNGRSFYELARLTPGAVLPPGGGNLLRIRANYISGTAVSGMRGSQTTFMLDGVDVTDHHQGGSLIQTSVDALQEFKVQQSAYSAEFSQAGGALNATTKSGSNQFHGALFEFMRDDRFDARNFFARETEELKRHQFGGTIGGPMLRNRTFFFASYEGMRERQGLVFNNIVPSTAIRAGNFNGIGQDDLRSADAPAVPRQHDSREPPLAAGALLPAVRARAEHGHGHVRLGAGARAEQRPGDGARRSAVELRASHLRTLQLARSADGRSERVSRAGQRAARARVDRTSCSA